jgi:hypothetical protein
MLDKLTRFLAPYVGVRPITVIRLPRGEGRLPAASLPIAFAVAARTEHARRRSGKSAKKTLGHIAAKGRAEPKLSNAAPRSSGS